MNGEYPKSCIGGDRKHAGTIHPSLSIIRADAVPVVLEKADKGDRPRFSMIDRSPSVFNSSRAPLKRRSTAATSGRDRSARGK